MAEMASKWLCMPFDGFKQEFIVSGLIMNEDDSG